MSSLATAFLSLLPLILGAFTLFSNFQTAMTQLLSSWLRSTSAAGTPATNKRPTAAPRGKGDPGLQGVFATFDRDRDGYITKEELKASLEKMGISTEDGDVAEMVERVDGNKDGLVDLEEFSALYGEFDGDLMREAFDVFDGDRDGFISEMELRRVLSCLGLLQQQGNMLEACKEMIRSVDVDGDGMVNFDEFKRMMMMDNNGGRSLILVS
ncbi:hypothetical protein DM860_004202 [Cuscuta australis]|uniref:EF-hand domain-containing protein n=1 Tax=Cuscuta australis TaxID=267555 RepID=A0A328CXB6_9ASTE|nr:hypothetical protein DM860_004202 [Cuscuta australis]